MKIGHKSEIDIIMADLEGIGCQPVDHHRSFVGLQRKFWAPGGSAVVDQKNRVRIRQSGLICRCVVRFRQFILRIRGVFNRTDANGVLDGRASLGQAAQRG
jgi:hypothetical protein